LKNGNAFNRSYPFTYTISAANTWEYKTVTVVGDTSGTWQTGNLGGLIVYWDLGCGSSLLSTANTWQGANYNGVTGSTRLISTLNATLDITGVQLEKGTVATSFDFRSIGTELALCQRYFEKSYSQDVVPTTATANGTSWATGNVVNSLSTVNFAVVKRAAPSVSTFGPSGGASFPAVIDVSAAITQFGTSQAVPVQENTTRSMALRISNGVFSSYVAWGYQWTASSEL